MPPYTPIVIGTGTANHPLKLTGAGDTIDHPIHLDDEVMKATISHLQLVSGLLTFDIQSLMDTLHYSINAN